MSRKCKHCFGRGECRCSRCAGTGSFESGLKCYHCQGRGQIKCPVCDGRGAIDNQE